MKLLAINGSPRKEGNSSSILSEFLRGAAVNDCDITEIRAGQIKIKPCNGCLKCDIYKECVLKDDEWGHLSKDILESDVIVIASPVYFHHFPGPLKNIIDRFRSFVSVQVTKEGLIHTPWRPWTKRFVLLLSLGSPIPDDAQPIIDLFSFMTEILGPENSLEVLTATCLQMNRQVKMNEERLAGLYSRVGIQERSAHDDYLQNCEVLEQAFILGTRG
jgi:FMN-dependent NADH-azoreductase